MRHERSITFRLPEMLFASAERAARAEELSTADFIRAALAERVSDAEGGGPDGAVAVIRRALRRNFDEAGDWVGLQTRLRAKRLVLREIEGELWLHTWPVERRLLPLVRLGVTREELTLHYRTAFPPHGSRPAALGCSRGKAQARGPNAAMG
jgi:hypothetical protein